MNSSRLAASDRVEDFLWVLVGTEVEGVHLKVVESILLMEKEVRSKKVKKGT